MQNFNNSELIEKFISAAKDATATVERIPQSGDLLNKALLESAENELVLFSEPEYIDPELFSVFKQNQNVITNPNNDQLSKIKTGVTDAFCGIAATGSVCVSVKNNLSSPISSLTRKHIVIVKSNTIIPRPSDLFSARFLDGRGLKLSYSIITGTSATADMGPLVRGVHGPGKLHIIIVE